MHKTNASINLSYTCTVSVLGVYYLNFYRGMAHDDRIKIIERN